MFLPFLKPDLAKVLHKEVENRLIKRLEVALIEPKIILEITSNNTYSKHLKRLFPQAKILRVNKLFQAQNVQAVDLVFASSILHPPTELPAFFAEIKRILKPEGLIFFSMFGLDTLLEFQQSLRESGTPYSQTFVDLHDIGDLLLKTQFNNPVMEMEKFIFTYKTPAKLIKDAKNFTQKYLGLDLSNQSIQQPIIKFYETCRDQDDQLPVTIEVIYGHAWGRLISEQAPGEISVPISSIKKKSSQN